MDVGDERLKAVFGGSQGVPHVTMRTLEIYYDYLESHLIFPFIASVDEEVGPMSYNSQEINYLRLDQWIQVDDKYGILIEGRVEGKKIISALAELKVNESNTNYQLIDDYQTWFWND